MVKANIFQGVEKKNRRAADVAATDAKAFHAVVDSRRSVRVYANDPVPQEVVDACLDAALKAPNSSNMQTWEIHHVVDPVKKQALIEACLSQPAAATAPELFVFVARPDLWKRNAGWMLELLNAQPKVPAAAYQYYKKIVPLAYSQGPLGLLAPFKWLFVNLRGLRKPTPRGPIGKKAVLAVAEKSSALASAHFMLAMRAHGFDTCPMEGLDSLRVKRILGLPRAAGITMAISAGRRAEEGVYGPRLRFDAKHFVFRH